jgi:hypothetical protein
LIDAVNEALEEAYKLAVQSTPPDWSKVPSVAQLDAAIGPWGIGSTANVHHVVPVRFQGRFGLSNAEMSQMPALLLTKEKHVKGEAAFHNMLREYIPHRSPNQPGIPYSEYTRADLADYLRLAYRDFGYPDAWTVAKAWLIDLGKL